MSWRRTLRSRRVVARMLFCLSPSLACGGGARRGGSEEDMTDPLGVHLLWLASSSDRLGRICNRPEKRFVFVLSFAGFR